MKYKDNENYWIKRHEELKGDIRSVGNRGKPLEENVRGYESKVQRLRTVINKRFGSVLNKSVLEVGCGIGMMARDLIQSGALYTGIDISNVALQKAQELCPTGIFIQHSIVDYSLSTKYDIVFCTDVLVHLVNVNNWRQALGNMKNHLNGVGGIIIKEEISNEMESPAPHVVNRSYSQYQDVCDGLNLRFEAADSVPPGFYYLWPKEGG